MASGDVGLGLQGSGSRVQGLDRVGFRSVGFRVRGLE